MSYSITPSPRPRRFGVAAILVLSALATACGAAAGDAPPAAADTTSAATDASPAQAADPVGAGTRDLHAAERPAVRALYVNRFAAQSAARMRYLVALADSTEVNALVIDMKDEFGLNYQPENAEFARNAGAMGKLRNVRALVDTLRAHGVLPIARLVVFKDSVTARVHPEWTIRRADGGVWRDHKGLAWVNPYHRALWEYDIRVAEELARLGFGGIGRPNAEPYRVVHVAIGRARERNERLGVRGEAVRPYLQAFSLGKPEYAAEQVRQQQQAVYDAGYDGRVLWRPGSKYEPFEGALARGPLVSRRRAEPTR